MKIKTIILIAGILIAALALNTSIAQDRIDKTNKQEVKAMVRPYPKVRDDVRKHAKVKYDKDKFADKDALKWDLKSRKHFEKAKIKSKVKLEGRG